MRKGLMPKSYRTVFRHLETVGTEQTQKELLLATGLSHKSVRRALLLMKSEGLLVEKYNCKDGRQSLYSLIPPRDRTEKKER